MKRRRFMVMAGIGGVAAFTTSFKFITTPFESAAVALIKKELSFLKLDDDGVKKFVADFAVQKNRSYRLAIRGYSFLGIRSAQSGKVNQLVSAYLLSSDFFSHQMDETRIISYVRQYDPYLRPCAHPFSHIYYP